MDTFFDDPLVTPQGPWASIRIGNTSLPCAAGRNGTLHTFNRSCVLSARPMSTRGVFAIQVANLSNIPSDSEIFKLGLNGAQAPACNIELTFVRMNDGVHFYGTNWTDPDDVGYEFFSGDRIALRVYLLYFGLGYQIYRYELWRTVNGSNPNSQDSLPTNWVLWSWKESTYICGSIRGYEPQLSSIINGSIDTVFFSSESHGAMGHSDLGQNLVRNAGFESDDEALVPYWKFYMDTDLSLNITHEIKNDVGLNGTRGAKISLNSTQPPPQLAIAGYTTESIFALPEAEYASLSSLIYRFKMRKFYWDGERNSIFLVKGSCSLSTLCTQSLML